MMPLFLPGGAAYLLHHSNLRRTILLSATLKKTLAAPPPVCCHFPFPVKGGRTTRSHRHLHSHTLVPFYNKPSATSAMYSGHRPRLMHPATKLQAWSVPPSPLPLLADTAYPRTLYYATTTQCPTGCDGITQHLVVAGDPYINPIPPRRRRQCNLSTPFLPVRTRTIGPGNGYFMLA